MVSHSRHQTVECKTIDGIILEAWFYQVNRPMPAPAIIMTHGVSPYNLVSVSWLTEFLVQLRQGNERCGNRRRLSVSGLQRTPL